MTVFNRVSSLPSTRPFESSFPPFCLEFGAFHPCIPSCVSALAMAGTPQAHGLRNKATGSAALATAEDGAVNSPLRDANTFDSA